MFLVPHFFIGTSCEILLVLVIWYLLLIWIIDSLEENLGMWLNWILHVQHPPWSRLSGDFYLCGHSTLSIFRMWCIWPLPLLESDFMYWIIVRVGNTNTGIPISASFCRNILFQLWHIRDIIPSILLDIVDYFCSNVIMSYNYARCLMLQTFIKPYCTSSQEYNQLFLLLAAANHHWARHILQAARAETKQLILLPSVCTLSSRPGCFNNWNIS